MRIVENEGAIFRIYGPGNALPNEVWIRKEKVFKPYKGEVPKPVGWGTDLSDEEIKEFFGENWEEIINAPAVEE